MADPQAGEASGGDGDAVVQNDSAVRRRGRQDQVQEVQDELAQETKRTTLLDRVETQLRGRTHVARILFGFSIVDDRKTQNDVESQFAAWRAKQENAGEDLTGVLLFTVQGALHFLEGPTEQLFGALTFFNTLAAEAPGSATASIGPVRILHFTELHGVRTSSSWCSYVHPGKAQGGQQVQVEDSNCSEIVMQTYRKFLLLCLKAKESFDGRDARSGYRKAPQDQVPTVDEVATLLGKSASDYFFTYPEFHSMFVAPFNLVLHSELLWPMPPPLSY